MRDPNRPRDEGRNPKKAFRFVSRNFPDGKATRNQNERSRTGRPGVVGQSQEGVTHRTGKGAGERFEISIIETFPKLMTQTKPQVKEAQGISQVNKC